MIHRLIESAHDVWCVVTHRCKVRGHGDDPYIQWMRAEEDKALESASEIRERRAKKVNPLETQLLERLNTGKRGM